MVGDYVSFSQVKIKTAHADLSEALSNTGRKIEKLCN